MRNILRIGKSRAMHKACRRSASHTDLFIERYAQLLGWAKLLTEDKNKAEDLLHDAFIQFILCEPALDQIANLDGYLRRLLRNLHLAQVRRALCAPMQSFSILDYDSAEMGLCTMDSSAQVQARDELRVICQYACVRKETSIAGSILILRYFHGYYPTEIAQVVHSSRPAVDVRLKQAREEAQVYLEHPEQLNTLVGDDPSLVPQVKTGSRSVSTAEYREAVFASRRGPCLSGDELQHGYFSSDAEMLSCKEIGHIVSCPVCLDNVNHLLALAPLSERFPNDTIDPDSSFRGGPGGSGSGGRSTISRSIRRAKDIFEHRPQALTISVNGYPIASQKVSSELIEQDLKVNLTESVNCVEVFSELGIRMLTLSVEPLPEGQITQSSSACLSDGRLLQVDLDHSGYWPNLHLTYRNPDCEQRTSAVLPTTEPVPMPSEAAVVHEDRPALALPPGRRFLAPLRNWLDNHRIQWVRPAVITAVLAIAVIGGVYLSHRPATVPSASAVLAQSATSEKATIQTAGLVTHRSVTIEERNPATGEVLTRRTIESWEDGAKGLRAIRMFGDRGELIAGEWQKGNNPRLVYRNAKLRPVPATPGEEPLVADNVWMLVPSADVFSRLTAHSSDVRLDEQPSVYVLQYKNDDERTSTTPKLLQATLTVRRKDFHAVEQTVCVQQGGEIKEYRSVEKDFEQRPAAEITSAVFEPDPGIVHGSSPSLESATGPVFVPASVDLAMDVVDRLDRVNALVHEQIRVSRLPSGVLAIEGQADDNARKDELLNALHGIVPSPAVEVDISTADSAPMSTADSAPRLTVQSVEPQGTVPAAPKLREYLAAQKHLSGEALEREVTRFSNALIERSVNAQMHATVLTQIDTSLESGAGFVSPLARERWASFVRRHASQVRFELESLRRELSPVFPNTAVEPKLVVDQNGLSAAIGELARLTAAVNNALGQSFGASAHNSTVPEVGNKSFWNSLNTAEALASAIERAVKP